MDEKTLENLKSWQKGQSGNPRGKKKGTKNRKTIVREMLESVDNSGLTTTERIVKALIKKALKGDVKAFHALMDSGYGKIKEEVQMTHSVQKMDSVLIGFTENGEQKAIEFDCGRIIEGDFEDVT